MVVMTARVSVIFVMHVHANMRGILPACFEGTLCSASKLVLEASWLIHTSSLWPRTVRTHKRPPLSKAYICATSQYCAAIDEPLKIEHMQSALFCHIGVPNVLH